jgi:hypothetical protein
MSVIKLKMLHLKDKESRRTGQRQIPLSETHDI